MTDDDRDREMVREPSHDAREPRDEAAFAKSADDGAGCDGA